MKRRKFRIKNIIRKSKKLFFIFIGVLISPFTKIKKKNVDEKKKKQNENKKEHGISVELALIINEAKKYIGENKIDTYDLEEINGLIKYANSVSLKNNFYLMKKAKDKLELKMLYVKKKIYTEKEKVIESNKEIKKEDCTLIKNDELYKRKERLSDDPVNNVTESLNPIIKKESNKVSQDKEEITKQTKIQENVLKKESVILGGKDKLYENQGGYTKQSNNYQKRNTYTASNNISPINIIPKINTTESSSPSVDNTSPNYNQESKSVRILTNKKKTAVSVPVKNVHVSNKMKSLIENNIKPIDFKEKKKKNIIDINNQMKKIYIKSLTEINNIRNVLVLALMIISLKEEIYGNKKNIKKVRKMFNSANKDASLSFQMINSAISSLDDIETYINIYLFPSEANSKYYDELMLYIKELKTQLTNSLNTILQDNNKKVLKKSNS